MKASELYVPSDDYFTLSIFIHQGQQIICLVDHIPVFGNKTVDVAMITEEFEIRSRGIRYSIPCPEKEDPTKWFKKECKRLNLKWITPTILMK